MTLKQFKNEWGMYPFINESGPYESPISKQCVKDFKQSLKSELGSNYVLHGFKHNHFTTSGFVIKDEKIAYVSIGDLRACNWVNNVLFRTAESTKDFRGRRNNFTSVDNLGQALKKMLEQ